MKKRYTKIYQISILIKFCFIFIGNYSTAQLQPTVVSIKWNSEILISDNQNIYSVNPNGSVDLQHIKIELSSSIQNPIDLIFKFSHNNIPTITGDVTISNNLINFNINTSEIREFEGLYELKISYKENDISYKLETLNIKFERQYLNIEEIYLENEISIVKDNISIIRFDSLRSDYRYIVKINNINASNIKSLEAIKLDDGSKKILFFEPLKLNDNTFQINSEDIKKIIPGKYYLKFSFEVRGNAKYSNSRIVDFVINKCPDDFYESMKSNIIAEEFNQVRFESDYFKWIDKIKIKDSIGNDINGIWTFLKEHSSSNINYEIKFNDPEFITNKKNKVYVKFLNNDKFFNTGVNVSELFNIDSKFKSITFKNLNENKEALYNGKLFAEPNAQKYEITFYFESNLEQAFISNHPILLLDNTETRDVVFSNIDNKTKCIFTNNNLILKNPGNVILIVKSGTTINYQGYVNIYNYHSPITNDIKEFLKLNISSYKEINLDQSVNSFDILPYNSDVSQIKIKMNTKLKVNNISEKIDFGNQQLILTGKIENDDTTYILKKYYLTDESNTIDLIDSNGKNVNLKEWGKLYLTIIQNYSNHFYSVPVNKVDADIWNKTIYLSGGSFKFTPSIIIPPILLYRLKKEVQFSEINLGFSFMWKSIDQYGNFNNFGFGFSIGVSKLSNNNYAIPSLSVIIGFKSGKVPVNIGMGWSLVLNSSEKSIGVPHFYLNMIELKPFFDLF
jgi:hypothetical protein